MFCKKKHCLGRNLILINILVLLLPHLAFSLGAGDKYVEQANRFLDEGYDLQAILSYRHVISTGLKDPTIMRNMALAYYNLRMLDEAIENMEIGVEISLRDPNMLTELGILYGARGDLPKSISVLKESLRLDPSQGDAYIYLGLALLRQGDAKLAWQAARIAEKLHQNPFLLVEKLQKSREKKPEHYPFQDSCSIIALRQIVLDNAKQGEDLIARWLQGESLAELFQGRADSEGRTVGGYVGVFAENELKPEILEAISRSKNYDPPAIVQTGSGYLLVQRVWPFDPRYWPEVEKVRVKEASRSVHATVKSQVTSDDSSAQEVTVADVNAEESFKLEKIDPRKIRLFAGSFQQKKRAIERLLNLREMGLSAYYLEDRSDSGSLLYNVIAGEFSSLNDVLKTKALLKEKGYDSFYFKN